MMNNSQKKENIISERANIISTVQTPLGFFTLVVLVVEAILGMVAGFSDSSSTKGIALFGMIGIIAGLVAAVAFMAYKRPEALKGGRPVKDETSSANTYQEKLQLARKFILKHNATIHSKCDCELTDLLYIAEDKTSIPVPVEKLWSYKNSNCNLYLNHPTEKAFLEFDAEIKDNEEYVSQFNFSAFGTFDGAIAYLEYSLTEKGRKNRRWKGVTILRIPKSGIIYGNWMTTGILSHARIGLGSIQLRRRN